MSQPVQESVVILGKEYAVACTPEQKEPLHESARLLDRKMREIKEAGKIIGTERIAVMAALNLAHELLETRGRDSGYSQALNERLRRLQDRIDAVLDEDGRQLTL
jgi:cell division protein ZapA